MFHFHVQTVIEAFLEHAISQDIAPEVMAYLKVRPGKLDDTQVQLANDYLVGASPRGWEDVSNVLKSDMSEHAKRVFVQGRVGAANAAEFFCVLREIQASVDVVQLMAARSRKDTVALLPRTLNGLYGMTYGLLAACVNDITAARALEIVEQLPDIRSEARLPLREVQTLAMELLMQKALTHGLEGAILESPSYRRYADQRHPRFSYPELLLPRPGRDGRPEPHNHVSCGLKGKDRQTRWIRLTLQTRPLSTRLLFVRSLIPTGGKGPTAHQKPGRVWFAVSRS